jgi:hypothetical protein
VPPTDIMVDLIGLRVNMLVVGLPPPSKNKIKLSPTIFHISPFICLPKNCSITKSDTPKIYASWNCFYNINTSLCKKLIPHSLRDVAHNNI